MEISAMGRGFNYERVAMVLYDSIMLGDRKAADKWGITQRSIQNYRHRLQNDEKLRNLTKEYRNKQAEKWLEGLPTALTATVDFMKQAAQSLSPEIADNLQALTSALEVLGDMHFTNRVIKAHLKN